MLPLCCSGDIGYLSLGVVSGFALLAEVFDLQSDLYGIHRLLHFREGGYSLVSLALYVPARREPRQLYVAKVRSALGCRL